MAARVAAVRRAPRLVQEAVLARAEQDQEPEQAAALPARELVDQVEAAPGEVVHRLDLQAHSLNRCAL
jgi:hypothetical protein